MIFIKNSVYKDTKKHSKKSSTKEEKTLDYYIDKVSGDAANVNWWDEDNVDEVLDKEDHKKLEFLKRNVKASSVIPENTVEKQSVPNNMGYFDTKFGTIAVGYKKYKKDSPIAFSIVPDGQKSLKRIPSQKIDSPNTYFGGPMGGKNTRFKASRLSFVFDPSQNGDIDKLEEDEDGIVDSQEKLLYQDKKEEDKIEDLEDQRKKLDVSNSRNIDKELKKIRIIIEEKEEDNLEFLKEIRGFVDKLKKGKLKEYIDADDFISMKKRIIEMSSEAHLNLMSLNELRGLLDDILKAIKKKNNGRLPDYVMGVNFDKFNKEKLREMIVKLRSHFFGDNL